MLQFQANRTAGRDGGPELSPVVRIDGCAYWVDLVPTELLERLDQLARSKVAELAAQWREWNCSRKEADAPPTDPHPMAALSKREPRQ